MNRIPDPQPINNSPQSPLREARARAMQLFLEQRITFFVEKDMKKFVVRGWTHEQVETALDDLVRDGKVELSEECDEPNGVSIMASLVALKHEH